MNILVFAGSNSSQSINKRLLHWVQKEFLSSHTVDFLDLNDFEMPLYSFDREKQQGIPDKARLFSSKVTNADAVLCSLAEHNGSYSAAFKNIFDWVSRIPESSVFQDKAVFIMATSPGARGGLSVLETARDRFPRNGASVIGTFSLPNFHSLFDDQKGILDEGLKSVLAEKMQVFLETLSK